ncbi:hypothetical protein [Paracoccus salsus]|uniref:hypothetical protein n=1 Tax=Paracoccus salsus TaxID=2911061 RepID=UPI001F44231F|nr:hypothetical protein [Paracoccus salsus]MCF3972964.1 hypothetical protein [Paracoccus salsus]
MTRKEKPSPLFGQHFRPPETLQDRTTAAAKLIIEEDRSRRDEISTRLREARLERDEKRVAAAKPKAPAVKRSRKKASD